MVSAPLETTSTAAPASKVRGAGLALLLALAPLVFLPGGYDAWNLPQTALVEIGALVLFLLWLVRTHSDVHWQLPRFPFGCPLACFLVWAALSLLWASNRYEGAVVLLHWTACALVLVLVAELAQDSQAVRLPLLCLLGAGTLVSLLGIAQRLWSVDWVPQAFPPAATFGNKNMAAQFVLMTIPLAIGFALESRRAALAALSALCAALMGGYLLYTLTRSAWLALALEVIFIAAWIRRGRASGRTRRSTVVALLVGAAGLIAIVLLGPGFVRSAYETLAAPWHARVEPATPSAAPPPAAVASVQGRLAIWRNTLAMVRDNPVLGVGLGNHSVRYPAYARAAVVDPLWGTRSQLDYAHNEYLQAWAELGIVGLALLLWLGTAIAALLRGAYQDVPTLSASHLSMAAAAGLLGIAVDAAFSFPFRRAVPPLVAAVYLGLLASRARHRTVTTPAWAKWLAAAAAGAALVATARLQMRWIRADWHVQRAHEAEARRDWPTALAQAEAARGHNVHPKEARFAAGMAYLALGDPRRAASAFEEILASYPHDLVTLVNLSLAFTGSGDLPKALESVRGAIALKPDEPVLHFRAASLLASLGDAEGALEEHRLAARSDPRSRFYQFQWGVAAMQSGAFAEAEQALGMALAVDPWSAATHKALGVLLAESLGRRREGVEHLRQALTLDPRIKDGERMRQIIAAYEKEQVPARSTAKATR